MANLKLQGSTYHARLTIPKDVRIKFGNKSELWRTTGTGDKRKAEILGAEMVARNVSMNLKHLIESVRV